MGQNFLYGGKKEFGMFEGPEEGVFEGDNHERWDQRRMVSMIRPCSVVVWSWIIILL